MSTLTFEMQTNTTVRVDFPTSLSTILSEKKTSCRGLILIQEAPSKFDTTIIWMKVEVLNTEMENYFWGCEYVIFHRILETQIKKKKPFKYFYTKL